MNAIAQEISTDYDLDCESENAVFDEAFGDDIDTLYSDIRQGDVLDQEIDQLLSAMIAVERFGMNPSAFGVLKATHLLSGTSLNALAMENFIYDKPEGDESAMALEALTDKIKEKAAAWSAKILSVTNSIADKITATIGGLWTKISDLTKTLTSKTWDKTKATGQTIKAHPYKTVLAAVTAAAAVAGIIMLVASMPSSFANKNTLQSFAYRVQDSITKIKWPMGSIVPHFAQDASKMRITITPIEAGLDKLSGPAAQLGWTQSAVKALSDQTGKAWATLKSGGSALVSSSIAGKIVNLGVKINDIGDPGAKAKEVVSKVTGSNITGWMSQQLTNKFVGALFWSLIAVITSLLKNVVFKAFHMVYDTFTSLKQEVQPA